VAVAVAVVVGWVRVGAAWRAVQNERWQRDGGAVNHGDGHTAHLHHVPGCISSCDDCAS